MSYSAGLVRLLCQGCGYNSFVKLQPLLTATSVACPRCGQMVALAEIEAASPNAGRLMGIMRQLAQAKERRGRPAPASEPALTADPSPVSLRPHLPAQQPRGRKAARD